MSIERRETVVNERKYQMLVPGVRASMPICTKVAVLLGPVLASLNKEGMDAFTAAIAGIDPAQADKLFMEAVSAVHLCFEGKPISDETQFELHFNQYRGDTYQVCIWCLWECVKDFFPQLGALSQIAQKAMESASQTDGASTTG